MEAIMRIKNKFIASAVFATALLAGAAVSLGGAQASIVYSEDFNNIGFQGSQLDLSGDPVGNKSDKYNPANYYNINSFNGWTFTTGTYLTVGAAGTDGAVLLNEDGGTALNVIGLAANQSYTLKFDYYGDNRPLQPWVLKLDVNGSTVDTINGADLQPGTNPGTTESLPITSTGAGTVTLFFWQASQTQASPIIDNVIISQTPLPATWLMLISGFVGLGFFAYRGTNKRNALAAA
jgi:hypothetical protein